MKFNSATCILGLALLLPLQPVLAQAPADKPGAAPSQSQDPLLQARASARATKGELKAAKSKLKADRKANADASAIAADEERIRTLEQDLQAQKARARVEMQRRSAPVAM
jgi:hypothetical protein